MNLTISLTHPIQTAPQSDNNEITLHSQTYNNENHTHTHKYKKHVSSSDLNPKIANLGLSSERVKGKMGRGVKVLGWAAASAASILSIGGQRESVGLCADIENERLLEPWDEEVSTFVDGLVENSTDTVEDDGMLATIDSV